MLSKIRYFTLENLRNIYFGIFSSLLNYGAQIWGQHLNIHIKRILKLQDRAIRIINFANFREPTPKLYKKSGILKFKDNIALNNYIFVHDSLNRRLPTALLDKFVYLNKSHQHNTRNSANHCVKLPKSRTLGYGTDSITSQSAKAWNFLQSNCSDNMHLFSRNKCKKIIRKFYLDSY